MNELELIGIKQLKTKIISSIERCDDKNDDRFQHERIFLQGELNESLKIINAIIDNTTYINN